MSQINIFELRALYMNYLIHSFTGRIIVNLADCDPVGIAEGSVAFRYPGNPAKKEAGFEFRVKFDPQGFVLMQKLGEPKFTKVGTLVSL